MDTTLNTKNCYFDYRIDRKSKPTTTDFSLMEMKDRKLFWNLKFNYPGKFNLRVQLHMPEELNELSKNSIEAGIWGPGEKKLNPRTNLHPIHNNDSSHRLVWFNMGTFNIANAGLKYFYIAKLKSGHPFGIAKVCFEYIESGNEEYEVPTDELVFDDTETGTIEGSHINLSEMDDVELDFDLNNFEAKPDNVYVKDTFARHEGPLVDHEHPRNLLPKGISKMIEEVVPHNEPEREALYHAEPAFLLTLTPSTINEVGGLYREMRVTKHEPYSYYTLRFSGGHVGMVYDGDKGYLKLEVEQDPNSEQKCTVMDKNPNSGIEESDEKVVINFTHNFKPDVNYKIFIRIKYMQIAGVEQTVYYCYFARKKDSNWRYVGGIAKPGKIPETILGSSIENIGSVNGHLYERRLATGNTWIFDTNKYGLYVNEMTYVAKDPNNSIIMPYKDNRVEMQIGGRYGGIMMEQKDDFKFIVTGKEKTPKVPWDSVEKNFK